MASVLHVMNLGRLLIRDAVVESGKVEPGTQKKGGKEDQFHGYETQ